MPVEVESTSQVEEFLRVLRRRVWWILIPFTVFATLGSSFAVLVPKKYVAKTRILVREVRNRSGQVIAGSEGQAKVAKHLIRSPNRIRTTIQQLGWPWDTLSRIERDVLVEKVLNNLSVDTPQMGPGVSEQIVEIKYADTDPDRAVDFTELVSQRWREERLEANRKAIQRAYENLDDRNRSVELRIQAIGEEIAGLMERNEIPPWKPDYYNPTRPLAPEFEALETRREELALLESEVEEGLLEISKKRAKFARMDDTVVRVESVESSSIARDVQKRRELIQDFENEIREKGYKPTLSRYVLIRKQISVLESEIAMLEEVGPTSSISEKVQENVDKVSLGEEIEELEANLDRKQQKHDEMALLIQGLVARTAELQSVYQQLDLLESERDRLNENLVDFGKDLQGMRIELDLSNTSAGDPFIILDPVERPSRPTEPSPTLIAIFSILMGFAIGLGLAVVLEYSKNCFRSVHDVTRVMVVPVLGAVGSIVTNMERRRRRIAQRALAGSTVLFVTLIGYVTWAWESRQDLLSDGLRQAIENFRRGFE